MSRFFQAVQTNTKSLDTPVGLAQKFKDNLEVKRKMEGLQKQKAKKLKR